jgi:acyl-CoA synthetase (AMP-forming)/AMP-acid ligase II
VVNDSINLTKERIVTKFENHQIENIAGKDLTSGCDEGRGTVQATSLVSVLEQHAIQHPDALAFRFLDYSDTRRNEHRISYSELELSARRLAALLQQFCSPGDRALLLYEPGLAYYEAFFACLYAGVVAVPAYPPTDVKSIAKIENIVSDCGASVVCTSSELLPFKKKMADNCELLIELPWINTEQSVKGLEHLFKTNPGAHETETLAFLQYTSGSTGDPKGVMLSHRNLLANLEALSKSFEITEDDHYVTWLPPYHDMGLIGSLLLSFYSGIPVTIMAPKDFISAPERWLQAMSDFRATISGAPNFAYELCVGRVDPKLAETINLSNWQIAYSGAEPVRAETIRKFCEHYAISGFDRNSFYPCYGLAESTVFVAGAKRGNGYETCLCDPDAYLNGEVHDLDDKTQKPVNSRELVSCGYIAQGHEVIVVKPDMSLCEDREIGEILVYGPSVARGYWNRKQVTAETFYAQIQGSGRYFLRTGDIGAIIDGQLYISGRCKDVIIHNGMNHYPQDIEHCVEKAHGGLRPGCGVAFLEEQTDNPGVIILQEVRSNYQVDADKMTDAILNALRRECSLPIRSVILLQPKQLPKTSSGKICRQPARQLFAAGRLNPIHEWSINGAENFNGLESVA